MKGALLVLLWFLTTVEIYAIQPLIIKDGEPFYAVGKHSEMLTDPSQKMTFEEVRNSTNYVKVDKDIPNSGLTQDVHWLHFKVINQSSKNDWILVLNIPVVDRVELYWKSETSSEIIRVEMNEETPLADRNYSIRIPVASITLQPGLTGEFWMRFWDESTKPYPVQIWQPRSFLQSFEKKTAFIASIMGALGVLFFCTFLFWLVIRWKLLIYYFVYIGSFLVFDFYWYGFNSILFPAYTSSYVSNRIMVPALSFGIFWMIKFSCNFVNSRQYAPRFHRIAKFLAYIQGIGGLIALSPNFILGVRIMNFSALVIFLFLLIMGLWCWKKGAPMGGYYSMASSFMLLGTFATAMKSAGLLDQTFLTEHGTFLGQATEALLLSFGIAYQFNQLKNEKEKAQVELLNQKQLTLDSQQKLVTTVQNQKVILEKTVKDRTHELELSNLAKDKLFSIIGHDLRNPIGGVSKALDLVQQGSLKLESTVLQDLSTSSKMAWKLLEDLLSWARGQKGEQIYCPQTFHLETVIQPTLDLLGHLAKDKNIDLKHEGPSMLKAWADPAMIETIVRNLVGNSIKFTEKGGEVIITCKKTGGMVQIAVKDNGFGINPAVVKKLFLPLTKQSSTKDSNNEPTAGLGLNICNEFIQLNQGQIGIDSVLGEGTTVWIYIPAHKVEVQEVSPS
ncbi:MAG: sensor histidine kinase [Proteobacteria bacterium]|nr:sensor histidine kinase [Pseudomonadota bacterium]